MTRFFLVRHAESENNILPDTPHPEPRRKADPSLTPTGHFQARALSRFLGSDENTGFYHNRPSGGRFAITRLMASPMLRAMQTADPIAHALGLNIEVWTDLYEQGGVFKDFKDGRCEGFPGLTRYELERMFPGTYIPEDVTGTGWYDTKLGYERPEMAYARGKHVVQCMFEIARDLAPGNESIVMVSHGLFIDIVLKTLLGRDPAEKDSAFRIFNTSISRVDISADGVVDIRAVNRMDHLNGYQY